MQITKKNLEDTKIQLQIAAEETELQQVKDQTVARLSRNVKVPGFRAGKAPLPLIERHLAPSVLQTEFLDDLINKLYAEAVQTHRIRVVAQPQVSITKFVPFSTLEFTAEVEAVGDIKLPDYTKIKLDKEPIKVTTKDVNEVLEQLRTREAEKKDVKRPAKEGDQVWIDFAGVDAKTKEPIQGADGKEYPLVLGSHTFIPGFEPELVGLKTGDKKTFDITFPKTYGVKALQSKKVSFTVTVTKVQEVVKPAIDDAFAAKIGPFKSVAELKSDIKKQLTVEAERKVRDAFESKLIKKIAADTEVAVPAALIDEQVLQIEEDEKRNVVYRGQTWQEHLKEEGVSEEEHRAQKRPQAEEQVKMGLVLSEVATKEKIVVTPEELELRLQLIKGQYQDASMQAELDKPENRRDILNRMITEKTLAKLESYVTPKTPSKK